ncbi:MAG: glycerophosphodiester phosphodiesterase family protein [Aeoliella sp.]
MNDAHYNRFATRIQSRWFIASVVFFVIPQLASAVDIIGHRGNSSAAPENTIAAIDSAFNVGADHVEVDIRLTSDGHAVLMHDSSIDRTTNGSGAISSMTLAETQLLDAGSWFGPEFAGESVPTLADALVAVNHRGRILLDIKAGGMGTSIQAALDEASVTTGGSFTSDDVWIWPGPNSDDETNVIDPQYLLGSLPSTSQWQTPGYFEGLLEQGILGFDTGGGVSSDFASAAESHGLVVSVYTINSASSMQSWIDVGVTAMETDFPEVLFDLLANQPSADFTNDGEVDGDDWLFFVARLGAADPGPTDFTGDGVNNHADFLQFQKLFEAANGAGSLHQLGLSVPEPASGWLFVVAAVALILPLHSRKCRLLRRDTP